MEILFKRKILLENSVDRTFNSPTWGEITATTFFVNIVLTQSMDNMGIFTDIEYFPKTSLSTPPDYTILIEKLSASGLTFPFMTGGIPTMDPLINNETLRIPSKIESDYYNYLNLKISGYTDSKIEDVRSYKATEPFRVGFNTNADEYLNYKGESILGISRVVTMADPRNYVFDSVDDANLGTDNQVYGLRYLDYTGDTRQVTSNGVQSTIPVTKFDYVGEGWNQINTSLSASTKEEYLFGIISPPEVQSEVFIERGMTSVMDKHLRLSEVNDLGELTRYGNGFYKLNKQ